MKQYLDKEQAKKLIDMGVDMSNVLLCFAPKNNDFINIEGFTEIKSSYGIDDGCKIPTLTIGELIERIPNNSHYLRVIHKFYVYYQGTFSKFEFNAHYELIDNLFDAYVWCLENNLNR